ncbi:MAG: amino acid ABC transporter substrate-binding protein [Gammaproteobacteria bacterium]|nr:amino acid ABC transporter substrate-binding protein [Gammaproteobacteria bacterium]
MHLKTTKAFLVLALWSLGLSTVTAQSQSKLAQVRSAEKVICGVNANLPGFSTSNSLDEYAGLDIDFCRAVAAAVLGDPSATEFIPTSSSERFDSLLAGEFDVLARNTTWTISRQSLYGQFVGVNYYDGQGFMTNKRTGVRSALELDNKSLCIAEGTTTALNAEDYFAVNRMRFRTVVYPDSSLAFAGYENGECEAISTDRSALAAQRTTFDQPDAHVILPEIISKEPLGPMVADGQDQWFKIVKWTLNCMINAEEMGVTSANVDNPSTASTPAARRLLGLEGELGEQLGLDNAWCANIVRSVGNYGESYARHLGVDTPIGLARGVNALWTDGGLMYAPPIR